MFFMTSASNGQPPTADASAAEAKTIYFKSIQRHVDTHWSYKKTLDNQFYAVQVTLILDKNLALSSVKPVTLKVSVPTPGVTTLP